MQSSTSPTTYQNIPITDLFISNENVRKTQEKNISETNIDTLASNIQQYGLLNPLTVRPSPDQPDKYEIIAGQRRFLALQRLDWKEVPCCIITSSADDTKSIQLLGLAENIQRVPLTVHDKCLVIYQLFKEHNEDLEAVARITNLSVVTIKRYIHLSQNLNTTLQQKFNEKDESKLTVGLADLLTKTVPEKEKQEKVWNNLCELKSNKDKKNALELLSQNSTTPIEEIVETVQQNSQKKKQYSRIKKYPWIFDENQSPRSIPKRLYGVIRDVIQEHGGFESVQE